MELVVIERSRRLRETLGGHKGRPWLVVRVGREADDTGSPFWYYDVYRLDATQRWGRGPAVEAVWATPLVAELLGFETVLNKAGDQRIAFQSGSLRQELADRLAEYYGGSEDAGSVTEVTVL